MNTERRPIITPTTHDENEREEPGKVQRELSGVYANPDTETAGDTARHKPVGRDGQSPAPPAGEASPHADLGTPHLSEETSLRTHERWQHIQAQFVDDPRKSVGEAHALVGELVQQIADGFKRERDRLEQQWSKGDEVSTEDLRLCLQNYRAFFSRLTPAMEKMRES